MNAEFSLIEQSYLVWKDSTEATKETALKLCKMDATLVFFRGRLIFSKNGWTPGGIPDRIYVTSRDNDRIKALFGKVFDSEPAGSPRQIPLYHFINKPMNVFEVHYLPTVEAIRTHIAETEKKFTLKKEPESCILS